MNSNDAMGPGMSRTDLRCWAKEEMLAGIDARIAELQEDGLDYDEAHALKQQRDRIAKFLWGDNKDRHQPKTA